MNIRERLERIFFEKKEQDQKAFNEFMTAAREYRALMQHITIVQTYQQNLQQIRAIADLDIRSKKEKTLTENFLAQISQYYEQIAVVAQRELEKNPQTIIQKMLDKIIEKIDKAITNIETEWTKSEKDYDDWKNKSWTEGIKNQAATYTHKSKEMGSDFIINAIQQQNGITLTEAEKTQLKNSCEEALQKFREGLERLPEDLMDAAKKNKVQLEYALLIRNMIEAMNHMIDDLNKQRRENNKNPNNEKQPEITKIDNSVSRCIQFANENAIGDVERMVKNMQNSILLQTLERQKERALSANKVEKIGHCELKPVMPFDVDARTHLAIQPQGARNRFVIAQACLAVNMTLSGQQVTFEKQLDGNFRFDFNNQHFYLDTRSGKFYGDNVDQKTFQVMLNLYSQIYKSIKMEATCDDPESKRLFETGIKNYNTDTNHANSKIAISSVTATLTAEKLAETEAEKPVPEPKAEKTAAGPKIR